MIGRTRRGPSLRLWTTGGETRCYRPAECEREGIAGHATAMHLDDEVVVAGALLTQKCLRPRWIDRDLIDARITGEGQESVDVCGETVGE